MNDLSVFCKIYKDIYDRTFNFFDDEQKFLMQFTVFLFGSYTQENDYNFIMLNSGTFSQNLQNDLFANKNRKIELPELSEKQKFFVSFMKKIIWNKPRICSIYKWMFYVSSIIYCKKHLNIIGEEMLEFIKAQTGQNLDIRLFNNASKAIDTIFF